MSKKLQKFLDEENEWRCLVAPPKTRKLLSLGTHEDRQDIANFIDNALSPENLSCDGELSIEQTRKRFAKLNGLAKDLRKMDPAIIFHEWSE